MDRGKVGGINPAGARSRGNPNGTAVVVSVRRRVWGFFQLPRKRFFLIYGMLVAARIDQSLIREDPAFK